MKTKYFIITLVLIFSLSFINMTIGQNKFESQSDAIKKAQADLVEILKSDMKLDLGVNAEQVQKAKALDPIKNMEVVFEQLLLSEKVESFNQLKVESMNKVVPLSLDKETVTVVQINKAENGWKITGMANKAIAKDLNQLPKEALGEGFANVTIYNIPNLNAMVYVLDLRANEIAYTNYNGYDFSEGVESSILLEELVRDARVFQKKYGELLKKEKLYK